MKLAIGTPWASPFMYTDTVDSLLNLRRPPGVEVKFVRGSGWATARHHNEICEKALAWGADAILIIGPDQVCEEDMVERLMVHFNNGCDVVTAMVPTRLMVPGQEMKPFQPMAWRIHETPERRYQNPQKDKDLIEIVTPEGGDLQEIDVIGSGVILFHVKHLKLLKKPWFFERITGDGYNRVAGMDSVFVWRLRKEVGLKVWVDTTIKVKHLHVFQIDDTFSARFQDIKT